MAYIEQLLYVAEVTFKKCRKLLWEQIPIGRFKNLVNLSKISSRNSYAGYQENINNFFRSSTF